MSFTRNILHLTKNALRAGGYAEDTESVLDARIVAIKETGPVQIQVMAYYDQKGDPDNVAFGHIYLSLDDQGAWVAEY